MGGQELRWSAVQSCVPITKMSYFKIFKKEKKRKDDKVRLKREEDPVSKRIDHVFINEHWARIFPDAYSEFWEPS